MNLLIFDPSECADSGVATLADERRLGHLRDILKVSIGDRLKCAVYNGKCGMCTVERLDRDSASFRLELTDDPPPKLPFTLVLALPRPQTLKKSLALAVTLGFREIHLIHTARTEKSYWQTPVLSPEGLHHEVFLALEQARDPVPPSIVMHPRFKPFAEDVLPSLMNGKQGFIAHTEESVACPCNVPGELLLAIGPEGGWVPFETEAFRRAGLSSVTLGERILRVEQAVGVFAGRLLCV